MAVGRKSHGPNAEQAWAGHAFVRAWDQGGLAGLTDIVAAMEGPQSLPIWQVAHAACSVAAGRFDDAQATLARHVDGRLDLEDNSLWLTTACLLVEVARALGDVERSAVLHRELSPYAGRIVVSGLGRVSIGPVSRYAGVAAQVAGQSAEADILLSQAATQCHSVGATPYLARTLDDHAAVRSALGDEDGARRSRERARTLAPPESGSCWTTSASPPTPEPAPGANA